MRSTLAWLLFVTWSGVATAGLFGDSITYEVLVSDADGRPLEGATVWTLGDSVLRTDFQREDLERLVRLHGSDVDFVFGGDLHPDLEVWRCDAKGRLRIENEDTEVHGLKRVRTHFAAFKRGYQAELVFDDARNNSKRRISFRLKADPATRVDARMERFDRIRLETISEANDTLDPARVRVLETLGDEMRSVADALERDGRFDDAAAIYMNLAYLPSIDYGISSTGERVIVGYTRGFDRDSKWRVANLDKARTLQRSHPTLALDASNSQLLARGLNIFKTGADPLRTEYVEMVRRAVSSYGERLWPQARAGLWVALNREGRPAEACRALQEYHDADPSRYTAAKWAAIFSDFPNDVTFAGGPKGMACAQPARR